MSGDLPGWNTAASYPVEPPPFKNAVFKNAVAPVCGFPYHGAMAACYKCGRELPPRESIFRTTLCEQCGSDVRVCRNCRFYLPGAHWDCRETISEAVRDKERANFCEYFSPGTNQQSGNDRQDKTRDRFNSLFGDG